MPPTYNYLLAWKSVHLKKRNNERRKFHSASSAKRRQSHISKVEVKYLKGAEIADGMDLRSAPEVALSGAEYYPQGRSLKFYC